MDETRVEETKQVVLAHCQTMALPVASAGTLGRFVLSRGRCRPRG